MGSELTPCPLPEGFEPMSDRQIAKNRRVADAIGENNVRRYTWKRANKEQEARGWASTVTLTMESSVQHNDSNMLSGFINVAAEVLTYALDSLRFERARAEAAEQRAEALAAEVAQARAEGAAAIARADLAEFKLRRFLPTESGRRCGSIPPCAGCCRDSSGAKCATPRKAQEAKAAEVETWADLYSRAKVAEAEAARLRAAIAAAVDMLPEWSTGALSHLSPAERAGDAARRALLAAQDASLTPGPA